MLDSQLQQKKQNLSQVNKPKQVPADNTNRLIRLAVAGDKPAFDELINQVYADIHRFSFHLVRNRTRAEDLTHDVVLKIARSIKQFKFDSTFLSWVYRIVVNTQKDADKKQINRLKQDNQYYADHLQHRYAPQPDDELEFNELLSAINQLPHKLKITLILVYAQHLSHSQVADVLECSINTVSWRIHEAKKQLKIILENRS